MSAATENRQTIKSIKQRLNAGALDYEQAKKEAEPVIASINEHGASIAKKYGLRPRKVTFTELMR